MNNLELIEQVLCYIDEHINEDIRFEDIAAQFHYSSFHFHRVFSAVTGRTISEYIKKRKLLYSYQKIIDSGLSITDICFMYGFKSVSTFNRLFKDAYNMTPSEARKRKNRISFLSVDTILEGYKKRISFKGDFILEPRMEQKSSFILMGYREHTSLGFQVIGDVWCKLKENKDNWKPVNPVTMYAFEDYSEDFLQEPVQFYYMAAVEVDESAEVYEGVSVKKIPASNYAIFTVNGKNQNGEIGKAFQYIYHSWLPNSEYCLSEKILGDFEYYDERWDCQETSSQMEIWIPIEMEKTC